MKVCDTRHCVYTEYILTYCLLPNMKNSTILIVIKIKNVCKYSAERFNLLDFAAQTIGQLRFKIWQVFLNRQEVCSAYTTAGGENVRVKLACEQQRSGGAVAESSANTKYAWWHRVSFLRLVSYICNVMWPHKKFYLLLRSKYNFNRGHGMGLYTEWLGFAQQVQIWFVSNYHLLPKPES